MMSKGLELRVQAVPQLLLNNRVRSWLESSNEQTKSVVDW